MLSRSSFRRPRIAAAAVTVGAALALSLTAIPAQAAGRAKPASTANLAKEQQAVGARIDARLKTLAALQTKVAGFKDLSADHRTTLSTLLSSDVSGLTTLKGKVSSETTVEGVRADAKSMIDDYRVYLLVDPKVRLVHVLDVEVDATARLVKVHDALADKLAKNAKADTQANKDLLADMRPPTRRWTARSPRSSPSSRDRTTRASRPPSRRSATLRTTGGPTSARPSRMRRRCATR